MIAHKTDKTPANRKHVVFMVRLFTPHIGGVETHVMQLSQELLKRGYSVTVVTEQYDRALPLEEIQHKVHILRIPQQALKSKWSVWSWMLQRKLLFQTADIIHAHDVFWWYLPLRCIYPLKYAYTTFHGYEGSNLPRFGAVCSRKLAETLSAGCICIGGWMKKWYHATPEAVCYGAAFCAYSYEPVKTNAVFIGRLAEDTGVLEYVRGVQLLQGKVTLDIFGDGKLKTSVLKLIYSTPYIRYHGETHQPEKELQIHTFAFVSRYLGIIEAQQTGRYVFAHWNNVIKRDYLSSLPTNKNMTMFSKPEELAQDLQNMLKNTMLRKQCIAEAYEWAKKQTWKSVTDMYEKLWKK